MNTYSINFIFLTVIRVDKDLQKHDLNATGEPCETMADLIEFIDELVREQVISAPIKDSLIAQIEAERNVRAGVATF